MTITKSASKNQYKQDIISILNNEKLNVSKIFSLSNIDIKSSNGQPIANVVILSSDKKFEGESTGEGFIDAIFKSIDKASSYKGQLQSYNVSSVSEGKKSLAKVICKVSFDGKNTITGRGLDLDTVIASAEAYINALNNYLNSIY